MPIKTFKPSHALLVPLLVAIGCTHPSPVDNIPPGAGGQSGPGGSPGVGGGMGGSPGVGGGVGGRLGSGGTTGGLGGASGVGGSGVGGAAGSPVVDAGPPDLGLSRGPTPPQPGVNFPFPQNRQSNNCTYPTAYRNEDVQALYNQWKTDTVTSTGLPSGCTGCLRVQRPKEPGLDPNSTVSEGIGYGMLLAVYMNDQVLFDSLWKYEQKFTDPVGLMNWYIKADGSGTGMNGNGAASDADEDMAFALVMADKQWGGKGTLSKNYIDIAKDQITAVWNHEIFQSTWLMPGDGWRTGNSALNPSYFAPAYYKIFAQIDTAHTDGWNAVLKSSYDVINASLNASNKNQSNGLVPAWCDSNGAPNSGAFGVGQTSPTNYQYDSCRTPFRIALDWCWNGDTRAHDYLAKTSAFFSGIGAAGIVDGYNLDGTPNGQYADHRSAAFIGTAAVGAMSAATYQSFVDQSYAAVATGQLLAGGTYYEDSWSVLSLLMMTGNFLNYGAY
jgi:endo-1,4-beta-D-glucanase Y